MFRKRVQIGMIHAAVAMTLVPINSTLNRIMIEDLDIPATLVVLLLSIPYLLSFIQVAIGSFSDRHPILGWRRTPYILAGLLLCVGGLLMATRVALTLPQNFAAGLILGLLTFGAWGMGFNFATVSYFSLASELSGEKGRSKTTAVMFFIMIICIILTAAGLSRMLEDFSAEQLQRAFSAVAVVALVMGLLGLAGLEPRQAQAASEERYSLRDTITEIRSNRQIALFFVYLVLMLAAILGQDVLLEPFAARALGMPVNVTTRITSIWGTFYLISLLAAGAMEGRISKLSLARISSWAAIVAFGLVAMSGMLRSASLFYVGVVLLGLATGPATVSNLSLMLDMTVPGKVGLYIGAWGSASAFARVLGGMVTALIRDLAIFFPSAAVLAYGAAFIILALFLLASLLVLRRIDISAFQTRAAGDQPQVSVFERAALAGDS